jgi:hypothetical protein
MLIRRNESARQISETHGYDHRVGLAMRVLAPKEDGLPTKEELEILYKIEDELRALFEQEQDSIHVLAITTSGFRELVFYTRNPKKVETLLSGYHQRYGERDPKSYIDEDKEWSVYRHFS